MRKHIYSLGAGFALIAGLLSGCGGGGTAATAAATSSNAGIAGVSTQVETAASFALDGLDAGIYGLPKGTAPAAPTQFEMPAGAISHAAATCTSGTSNSVQINPDQTDLVYSNCVVDGSTLDGTITISGPTAYTANGVWTATFAGFSVSGKGVDDKTVKFNYSGNQVIRNVTWSGTGTTAEATAAQVTMNVDINVDNGSSTIKFTNYLVDFTYNTTSTETTLNMSGKFAYDLKLADFGVPLIANGYISGLGVALKHNIDAGTLDVFVMVNGKEITSIPRLNIITGKHSASVSYPSFVSVPAGAVLTVGALPRPDASGHFDPPDNLAQVNVLIQQ